MNLVVNTLCIPSILIADLDNLSYILYYQNRLKTQFFPVSPLFSSPKIAMALQRGLP